MQTECTVETLTFQEVAGRAVVGRFDGGALTSDGGAVLLREVERATGILAQFADCFQDHRDPSRVTHSVAALVRQRIYGLALGYEDLNDHDALRHDPLVAVLWRIVLPAFLRRISNGFAPHGTILVAFGPSRSCR